MDVLVDPRVVHLTNRTGVSVRRTLPTRQVRKIGAWCFLDHYGPTLDAGSMSVAAHPHVGLQTVSWLFSGQLEHRDSLSTTQVINPGELNLMTAGAGIAHSELSEADVAPLHGVQLWVVLPDGARNQAPHFEHYRDLPEFKLSGSHVRVLIGDLLGYESPTVRYSDIVGAQVTLDTDCFEISLNAEFQYGLLPVDEDIIVNGSRVPAQHLLYLDDDVDSVAVSGPKAATFMLLGGEPFTEPMVMWWNFIGRSHGEIEQMRSDWENKNDRFPSFDDRIGGRIPAPEMPNIPLKSR